MGVIIGGAVVVDREGAVSVMLVAVGTAAMHGVTPIVDDLCHCGGDAASIDMAGGAVGILGAKGVIVLVLVPSGGQQWTDAVGEISG